jgi:hypothetical protein
VNRRRWKQIRISTNGGSFVADILGALGIGNQGSSKCVPADEKKVVQPSLPASLPQPEEEEKQTEREQDSSLKETDLAGALFDTEMIKTAPLRRAVFRKWLLLPMLVVFVAGAFFFLRNREPTPPAPNVGGDLQWQKHYDR